jgi:general secretion pathway protein J
MMNRARGFTLIEMLVALALVAMMSVAMLQAYRFSQRTLMQTTREDSAGRDIANAQRLLRRIVEQAYPFETAGSHSPVHQTYGLVGDGNSMSLTAPASAHMGGIGFYRYTVGLTRSGALKVAWLVDRNGEPSQLGADTSQDEDILEGVQSMSVAYLELIERSDGQVESNWRNDWMDRADLPALVRVRLGFAVGDRRRWPDLIVAPRISADANCVFDVVSQMCRVAS